jgi:pyruvate-formate lyase
MENNNTTNIDTTEPNVRVYEENGCTFIVKREFEDSGASILEQVISLLLDIMENKEKQNA